VSAPASVLAAAAEVEAFCRQRSWKFCFIGGLAVQRWGKPRFTQDVDLTLLTGFGNEASYVDPLLQHFSGRFENAREFALKRRVLLAKTSSGIDIDFSLGAFPFEADTIERATPWPIGDSISLTTCSAEDLIIHKAFAGRARDWADIETILARQHTTLNLAHVRRELPALLELKDDSTAMGQLDDMIALVAKRLTRDD
jgi:hypothetical protein